MPILDPSAQLTLCLNEAEIFRDNHFFLYYLNNASQNINRSFELIETYFQFERDLKENTQFLNELFKFNYDFTQDFINPSINNYYEYLYEKFPQFERNDTSGFLKGQYYIYKNDKQIGDKAIKANFFRPRLTKSSFHSWYFTDSPIALLCVNLLFEKDITGQLISDVEIYLINLEIDLIEAAGYTIVLSFVTNAFSIKESKSKESQEYQNNTNEASNQNEKIPSIQEIFIKKTIKTHNFAEIHFNMMTNNDIKLSKYYDEILRTIVQSIDNITGHFYIYSPFFKDVKSMSDAYLKILKNKEKFHIFNFSDKITSALKMGELIGSKEDEYKCHQFAYLKNGYDQEMIRIILCNVPIYLTKENEVNTMPSERSYLNWAYILKDDFNSWTFNRVPIIIDDNSNTHQFLERFINRDDIHKVNPQFFVNDTLYLTRTDEETLKTVKIIQDKSKYKTLKNSNQRIQKESIDFNFKIEKKIIKKLTYAVYVLQHMLNDKNVFLYKSQIFTAYEACKIFYSNDKKTSKNKGFIYQVETGEGKSFIIRLIAAVVSLISKSKLFKSGKTVHIASSNIILANRDYRDSYEFFKNLGLKSAVLLHKNEIPKKKELQSFYPKTFYDKSLFKNSSNMNYSICGIDLGESKSPKADVIFSTFVNFESFYLKMVETCQSKVADYFHNCYLLIDEADSILIDELANGTILSHPMKTNCKEVLTFVYVKVNEGKESDEIFKEVKQKWPNCKDLKEEDIQDMIEDIKLVKQEEFTNGKKYSIEIGREKREIKRKNIKDTLKDIGQILLNKISTNKTIQNENENKTETVESKNESETANDDDDDIEKSKTEKVDDLINTTENSSQENLGLSNDEYTSTEIQLDSSSDDDDDSDDDQEEIVDKNKSIDFLNQNDKKYIYYKYIVPFDYDHKGVLEPNKEFSGFVQQFIAIKEIMNDKSLAETMRLKEVSMNYLYVSHPIFVNIYKSVCGFTGTLGNKFDKEIFKNQYKLLTKKIPRSKPNRRIELPNILCSDLDERNLKIVNEVIEFHEKEFPVLVIFQDLNEITDVFEMLVSRGIDYINIFNGKDEKIKPDMVSGRKGAVSLGTNVCGRGTDIKEPEKPLHVIVSYFSSNSRVMQQAFGRTSRQGREGTVSIICLKDQFFSHLETLETNAMKEVLQDFQIKNEMQQQFIEDFRKSRSWIFEPGFKKEKIDKKYIKQMRESKVNVNRIRAYNFEFPICMSVPTFLMIQSQRIYSLYNCPNCKYTWKLFQRYVREMILESWSLFIDKADKNFKRKKEKDPSISYKKFLDSELEKIKPWLHIYLPIEKGLKTKDKDGNSILEMPKFGIVDTFMGIFNFVKNWGQKRIDSTIPEKLTKIFQPFKSHAISFNFGFKLYSLLDESGARIKIIDGNTQNRNYISDPELLYTIKGRKWDILSITRKIDDLFDSICRKLDRMIGSYTGLKLFLRRTLSGCEFGICFDFNLRNVNETMTNDPNCIIDMDPLFLFTIILKSKVPLLAGILIIGLIYLAKLAAKITEYIAAFPEKITKELVKKTVSEIVKVVAVKVFRSEIELFCEKINEHLLKNLEKQVNNLHKNGSKAESLFKIMLDILRVKNFSKVGDEIEKIFTEKVCKVKMNPGFGQSLVSNAIPVEVLLKMGLLLLLCFAAFMMNFNCRKDELKYDEKKVAAEYDKTQINKDLNDEDKNGDDDDTNDDMNDDEDHYDEDLKRIINENTKYVKNDNFV